MSRRRVAVLSVAACTAVAIVAAPAAAWAKYSSAGSAALPINAATLAGPTGVSASAKCNNGANSGVTVNWTATTSAFAAGYTVTLSPPSGSPTVSSVSGQSTTTANVPLQRSGTSYTVSVVANYQTWTSSAASASGAVVC